MRVFVASLFLVSAVLADKLDNTYLPPNNAKTAGGNGNFLSAPFNAQSTGYYNAPARNQFASASNQFAAASSQYDVTANAKYGTPAAFNQYSSSSNFQKSAEASAQILKFNNDNNGEGSYRFEYETDNKISHEENGELNNQGSDNEAMSVRGSYSYMGTDGIMYTVNYIADENGFRATGDHIPTPPPVPEAIQKSLDKVGSNSVAGYTNGYQSTNNYQNYHNTNGYQQAQTYQQGNGNNGYNKAVPAYQGQSSSNGYQYKQPSSLNNGYQSASSNQAANKQYLPPNKSSFNQQSGYRY